MKECAYCGRENADEAGHCRECGTLLVDPPTDAKTTQPRDWAWLDSLGSGLHYPGLILFIALLYLLSFGPVESYYVRTTSRPATPMLILNVHRMVIMTVSYPQWVRIVYYPAFKLRSASGGNGLYGRYLQWWDSPLPGQQ